MAYPQTLGFCECKKCSKEYPDCRCGCHREEHNNPKAFESFVEVHCLNCLPSHQAYCNCICHQADKLVAHIGLRTACPDCKKCKFWFAPCTCHCHDVPEVDTPVPTPTNSFNLTFIEAMAAAHEGRTVQCEMMPSFCYKIIDFQLKCVKFSNYYKAISSDWKIITFLGTERASPWRIFIDEELEKEYRYSWFEIIRAIYVNDERYAENLPHLGLKSYHFKFTWGQIQFYNQYFEAWTNLSNDIKEHLFDLKFKSIENPRR